MASMATTPPRAILAANLRRRIDADSREGEKLSVRAWALSKGLDVRMIDRLLKGQHAITLDKLDEIAGALGLSAWHLLIEDLDPSSTPAPPLSAQDREMLSKIKRLLV